MIRGPLICNPSEISGCPGLSNLSKPEIESARIEGLPLTTIVGSPANTVWITIGIIVGSREEAVASQDPSI